MSKKRPFVLAGRGEREFHVDRLVSRGPKVTEIRFDASLNILVT